MATKYKFTRTQTVTVSMADEGEDFEGEPVHWGKPTDQRESAEEYRDQAFSDEDINGEDFVEAEITPWEEVRKCVQHLTR